jgi:hypothetical protein
MKVLDSKENPMSEPRKQIGRRTLRNYESVIAHLLAGRSYKGIAVLMCVDEKQVRRWTKEDDFIALYNQTKKELLESMKDGVIGATRAAVKVVQDALEDHMASALDKLPAAKYTIDLARDFAQLINTDEDDIFVPVPGADQREDENE